jgi:hypothetical protein
VACSLTCQSTRTHNSRRRLRRWCWWSGHFHVMPRSRRSLSVCKGRRNSSGTPSSSALLGNPPSLFRDGPEPPSIQGPRSFRHSLWAVPRGHAWKHGREHRWFELASVATAATRTAGRRNSDEASVAVPFGSERQYPSVVTSGQALHNKSIDTDAQQKAASPQVLARRSFSRYASGRRT